MKNFVGFKRKVASYWYVEDDDGGIVLTRYTMEASC